MEFERAKKFYQVSKEYDRFDSKEAIGIGIDIVTRKKLGDQRIKDLLSLTIVAAHFRLEHLVFTITYKVVDTKQKSILLNTEKIDA